MPSFRLGDAIHVKHGFAFAGGGFTDDPALPTLITPGNFALGGGFKESKPKTYEGEFPKAYELAPGSLVVTMTDLSKGGDTLGLPATIPEGRTYLHNQRIGLVEVVDSTAVDLGFLNYYLRTGEYRAHVLATASGSTVRHTSPSRIEEFVATVPELNEQKAIAEILGAFDGKIAANERATKIALSLARARFDLRTLAVPKVVMSDAIEPILGGTPSRADAALWDGAVRWASAKDITGAAHGIVLDTAEGISVGAANVKRLHPLPIGSVALTARGTVGAVARLAIPASINQSCYGFVPDAIPASALGFVIEDVAAQAKALAHGSVFDTITMSTFEHVNIPQLSPKDWLRADAELAPLVGLATQLVAESSRLAATRDRLIPPLMSGEMGTKVVAS